MDYCTIEQLTGGTINTVATSGYLPQISSDEDKAKVAAVIARASRRIDSYVTENSIKDYFAPADVEATERTARGTDLSYLDLPEFVAGSVTTVTAPEVITVPTFVEERGKLYIVDENGLRTRFQTWHYRCPYIVTARWGFNAVPEDINEACLQLVVRTYRGADEAFSGVIGGINKDNNIIERNMPAPVREILDGYRRKYRSRRSLFA